MQSVTANDAIGPIPFEVCLDIRHTVLHPLKPRDFSRVEGDETATHYGLGLNGQYVACLSVFGSDPAQIRKFATLPEFQGMGFGKRVMEFALDRINGPVFLDARISAIGFYQRFGFECVGHRFYKGEIEHIRMDLNK